MSIKLFQSSWPGELKPNALTPICQALNIITLRPTLHHFLAQTIHPATKKDQGSSKLRATLIDEKGDYRAKLVSFKAADATLLEGVLFDASTNKAILFAPQEGERYESIANPKTATHHFIDFFRKSFPKYTILVINPRGIGKSQGVPSDQGFSLDYYAAWNFLESLGYTDIIGWGHSLGGKYLLSVAAWKQSENHKKEFPLIADRSFDNIAIAMQGKTDSPVWKIGAKLLYSYAGWGKNGQQAWHQLKGRKLIIHVDAETSVPKSASLLARVRSQAQGFVMELDNTLQEPHTRPYNQKEQETLVDFVTSSCPPQNGLIKQIQPLSQLPSGKMPLQDMAAIAMVIVFLGLLTFRNLSHIPNITLG